MPIFSLTQSPQWLSISPEGKLSVDWSAAPTTGFEGPIVVMATQGSLTATKQITFKLKPRYRPILDYIETAQYSSRRKTVFRDLSIELEFTEHRSIASQTHRFTDAFLGGTGGGANQITANGIPVVANNIPVVNHQDTPPPPPIQGAVTAVNIVETGPIVLTMGDFTDLTYTVSTNGGSMGSSPWQTVNCSVISGDASYVSIYTGSGYVSVDVTNGTPIGESVIIKVASAVDSTKFDTIEIIAKAIVSGVVIVPSKTTIDANETFTAQAYLTGQGVGTGAGSVGTQQFNWSVSGPANLANSIAQTATITGTDIAGAIVLSASFGTVSSSTNITNTGQSQGGDWTMVESYTVTRSPGGFGTVNYAKLNDFNFYTGVTAYNSSNGDSFININLGSALTVKAIDMGGGYLDPPWPNDSIADYLNGGFLEYSTDNSNWTIYATIADVTDYDGDFKRYTPNITAQFWRIRRQTWAAISELNFWV